MRAAALFLAVMLPCLCAGAPQTVNRTIGVFIALADNKTQGIVPVPAAIGNGDDPDKNLYWGTDEGLRGDLGHSKQWKLVEKRDEPSDADVLRTRTYRHTSRPAVLHAKAYRGSAIARCIRDFETAVQTGAYDLVVYIGHNGLMDFDLPVASRAKKQARRPDVIVLCCRSEAYFAARIGSAGGRPVLLTTQLMYPGAFLLRAAAEQWLDGAGPTRIRQAAGAAYAANQGISRKAATGVFAALPD